jgi:hypothetical protein
MDHPKMVWTMGKSMFGTQPEWQKNKALPECVFEPRKLILTISKLKFVSKAPAQASVRFLVNASAAESCVRLAVSNPPWLACAAECAMPQLHVTPNSLSHKG